MLPLWRDKVRIALCKDRLAILHVRGRGRRILSKQILSCTGTEPGWQPVLALLKSALTGKDWKKADATVILSNHFTRFLVLPWNEARLSDAEQMALVQHRFAEVYGEAGANWAFRLSEGSFGSPSMSSAIPQELLSQIKALFKESPLCLKSVQPYLMTAFNACRRELDDEAVWFVLAERDTFCVGLLQEGQWSSIRLRRVVTDWFEEAMLLLEREALLVAGGNKLNKVFVHAPEMAGSIPVKRGSWLVHPLKLNLPAEISQAEISDYAMAAAGM